MLNFMVIGTLAVAVLGAPAVSAASVQPFVGDGSLSAVQPEQPLPDGGEITVELVSYNGSGCPPDSAVVEVNPEKSTFTIKFSEYTAQIGADLPRTGARKNCQLTVDVAVPAGQTFAIVSADYRGYAYLESGATGLQKVNYYFQGMPETQTTEHRFDGPVDDNWQVSETADFPVYAPCEETRFLNINTELRVNLGTSDPRSVSLMTMDSEDHNIDTTYHVALRECDDVPPDAVPGM